MNAPTPQIQKDVARRIRQLDPVAINRIAAGEVVERPASAVKELVENAIDAGATRVEIAIAEAGRSLIEVSDNGSGIPAEDLPLALSRHATSKIDGTDLLNIRSFGFRGEALPAMAAVGRLTIETRHGDDPEGATITVEAGKIGAVRPCARRAGTKVSLAGLFSATPARLKFLKSDRAEQQAITDIVRRLALSEPEVAFVLTDREQGRTLVDLPSAKGEGALAARVRSILGQSFLDGAMPIEAEREGIRLHGFASLPTHSKASATAQYLAVNGRPVRDRMLVGALRGAYADVMARDRHPVVALFVETAPERVDVNVHPAKSEVRFREPGLVRGLIVGALKAALAEHGQRTAPTRSYAALGAFQPGREAAPLYRAPTSASPTRAPDPGFAEMAAPYARNEPVPEVIPEPDAPLGAARAQIHENYIVAQTADGMVLVDAHAAHERLTYEKLKARMAAGAVASQALLIPEIVELGGGGAGRRSGTLRRPSDPRAGDRAIRGRGDLCACRASPSGRGGSRCDPARHRGRGDGWRAFDRA